MNKSNLNYERRRGRHVFSALLFCSLFLFSPPFAPSLSAHGKELAGGEDKDAKSSVTFRVVAEQSQDPLIGAVVHCEGVANPSVTDIEGRCVVNFRRTTERVKVTVSYIGTRR